MFSFLGLLSLNWSKKYFFREVADHEYIVVFYTGERPSEIGAPELIVDKIPHPHKHYFYYDVDSTENYEAMWMKIYEEILPGEHKLRQDQRSPFLPNESKSHSDQSEEGTLSDRVRKISPTEYL